MIPLVLIGVLILCLTAEQIIHTRRLKKIPLRITVSGTRGKSSIVRTLASVFRSAGISVMAKTTGSEAILILPDGSEEPLKRNNLISIIEQKRVVAHASKLNVSCLISEIMSIQPENHRIETRKLLQPHLTLLSNFRADHTDVAGESAEQIAGVYQNDVFPGSTVILTGSEAHPSVLKILRKQKPALILTPGKLSGELNLSPTALHQQVSANLDLVIATARHQGISDKNIRNGILNTRLDIGSMTLYSFDSGNCKVIFVNAFAANDPVSTSEIIEQALKIIPLKDPDIIGLLALRADRGERSLQWLRFLKDNKTDLFDRIFVVGPNAPVLERRLNGCTRIPGKDPVMITDRIIRSASRNAVVFGIGNIHGTGMNLLSHWKEYGKEFFPTE
ncbi:MAG: poly-gamma-glutamate synthase PgsB [Bacteroidota bacterium]